MRCASQGGNLSGAQKKSKSTDTRCPICSASAVPPATLTPASAIWGKSLGANPRAAGVSASRCSGIPQPPEVSRSGIQPPAAFIDAKNFLATVGPLQPAKGGRRREIENARDDEIRVPIGVDRPGIRVPKQGVQLFGNMFFHQATRISGRCAIYSRKPCSIV